ncbi:MAG: hypothetical protein A2015_10390 [Spirochaetes bacterium GWF1_31_7]|nr:MAG: hypothetical protein A2Y30_16130 [Spirochaetes bacterium GWE1_32_154]OHD48507.1 MAG: hypothetical protein A2Y29_14105 [Spirochaetes bacterium GWE2_31_10]OHD51421.1 MAG: hypothetical protein A2015_10390 [Spirochaetes bacterium GWF1_31_7]HBD93364.1 hypothetical protein [Spirochaetia bacterium]HBI36695.1 hypothetical protein [Spirochaetia bacterium]
MGNGLGQHPGSHHSAPDTTKENIAYINKYQNFDVSTGSAMKAGTSTPTTYNCHENHTKDKAEKTTYVSDFSRLPGQTREQFQGTPVYTMDKTTFSSTSQAWMGDKTKITPKVFSSGTNNTQGEGYGFRILSTSNNGKSIDIYAHLNPESNVSKDFNELQKSAGKAGVGFDLPQGTQIGEVGDTGQSSVPHLHIDKSKP